MAAALYRNEELSLTGETDRLDDVIDAGAACDQRGTPVDCAVPDAPALLVTLFSTPQQGSAEARAQRIESCGCDQLLNRPHRRAPPLSIASSGSAMSRKSWNRVGVVDSAVRRTPSKYVPSLSASCMSTMS